jgi:hypothetical protein
MTPQQIVVLGAVIAGLILLGLLLALALAQARRPRSPSDERITRMTSLGMSFGMLLGAALGTIVWISTKEFVFWVIFMGGGMVTGLAIGRSLAERKT